MGLRQEQAKRERSPYETCIIPLRNKRDAFLHARGWARAKGGGKVNGGKGEGREVSDLQCSLPSIGRLVSGLVSPSKEIVRGIFVDSVPILGSTWGWLGLPACLAISPYFYLDNSSLIRSRINKKSLEVVRPKKENLPLQLFRQERNTYDVKELQQKKLDYHEVQESFQIDERRQG